MRFKTAASDERFVTCSALVWGFFGMCSHVNCQIAALIERFVAHRALVWGFVGVRSQGVLSICCLWGTLYHTLCTCMGSPSFLFTIHKLDLSLAIFLYLK